MEAAPRGEWLKLRKGARLFLGMHPAVAFEPGCDPSRLYLRSNMREAASE